MLPFDSTVDYDKTLRGRPSERLFCLPTRGRNARIYSGIDLSRLAFSFRLVLRFVFSNLPFQLSFSF